MKFKKEIFFISLILLIFFISLSLSFATDNEMEDNISMNEIDDVNLTHDELTGNISFSQENEKLEANNDEQLRASEDDKLEYSNSQENVLSHSITVNEEIEPYSTGGKIFIKDYFNQKINVYLDETDISNLKKGIGFESGTDNIVNVQTYKKIKKTVKKPVKKTVIVAKINKYSKKIIWNSKYFGKTINYALKYKYTGTYKKTKGKYIIIYQKYKGYKKVKKTAYKKVWAKKELIVNAFKVSKDCEYKKGYYLSFSYNNAGREFIWDYQISI